MTLPPRDGQASLLAAFDYPPFHVYLTTNLIYAFPPQTDEDQAEWVACPYDDDVDHDEEAAYGVEAMCRIIAALHAKATMPTALELVPKVCTGVSSTPLFPVLAS